MYIMDIDEFFIIVKCILVLMDILIIGNNDMNLQVLMIKDNYMIMIINCCCKSFIYIRIINCEKGQMIFNLFDYWYGVYLGFVDKLIII